MSPASKTRAKSRTKVQLKPKIGFFSKFGSLRVGLFVVAFVVLGTVIYAYAKSQASDARCGVTDATWGYAICHLEVDGSHYGTMVDKVTDGYCVELKRRTASGAWTTSGIWGNPGCTTGASKRWGIGREYSVYGLRLYRGNGNYSTLCNSQSTCY